MATQPKSERKAALEAPAATADMPSAHGFGASVASGLRYADRKAVALDLGISRQRLEKLIKQGRITETVRGIDIAQARSEYARTIDPSKKAVYDAHIGRGSDAPAPTAPAPASTAETPERRRSAVETTDPETGEVLDFSVARTRKEIANARKAELDYKSRSGMLLSREEVAAKEFAIARKLRDRITGFPARLANLLPPDAMKDLIDECEALCRELQDDIAAIAETTR